MDDKLTKVKMVFDNVKEMRSEISILFDSLNGRIKKLKEMYSEFVTYTKSIKTADVKSFIFSLDSFYFQTSLLQKEYDYLKDYYGIIVNRMYGEYYKLLKLITEYVEKSMIDNKLHEILKNKKYPKYDDLDDARQYPFELILQLNEDIIAVVNYLIHVLKDKEMSLKQYTTNQNYGLNVNNFVSTYNYEVIVLQEQINLLKTTKDDITSSINATNDELVALESNKKTINEQLKNTIEHKEDVTDIVEKQNIEDIESTLKNDLQLVIYAADNIASKRSEIIENKNKLESAIIEHTSKLNKSNHNYQLLQDKYNKLVNSQNTTENEYNVLKETTEKQQEQYKNLWINL